MNTLSLMQQTLGDSWYTLPKVIQSHYQLQYNARKHTVVSGTLHIGYPFFVKPILAVVRLMGGLIDCNSNNIQTTVEKWVDDTHPKTLFWKRTVQVQNGKCTVFASRMEYQQDNALIEFIGCGFGLHLKVSVENNTLVYRSKGYVWQLGKLRITIPDVLFLGHATIIETAVSDNEFQLDFNIKHSLFGETYRYGGIFRLN